MDTQTQKTMFSSATDLHATPDWLYTLLNSEFNFALDAAASKENAKHSNYLSLQRDSFAHDWAKESGGAAVFLNSPYGRVIDAWQALAKQWGQHVTVVSLIPARTDTLWFHDHCIYGAQEIRLIKGRLTFGTATSPAPFPSAVCIYRASQDQTQPAKIVAWDPPRPQKLSLIQRRHLRLTRQKKG